MSATPTAIPPQPVAQHWHLLDAETVLTALNSTAEMGLSAEIAEKRLQQYGANVLPEPPRRSRFRIFLDQFKSMPVALLTLAAIISVLTGGMADAIVIMGVVLINAVIGYATESQSDRIIHSLKHLVKPSARLIRAGRAIEVNAQEVVPGDILVLQPGTYVAADARVIASENLTVDEAVLTGESVPVIKTADVLTRADLALGDRFNMVHMGTLVTGGKGLAVVVATAQLTEMGTIQTLIGTIAPPKTPIESQLDQIGSQLVVISSVICGIVFAIGLGRGYDLLTMLKTSISLAVAAVPEGLPAVATTTLALGIWNMRRHKVLIRRLDAVETLGTLRSLCLDKTGTLTANQMSVVELSLVETAICVEDQQWLTDRDRIDPIAHPVCLQLLQTITLCNDSEVNGQGHRLLFQGSSTENALLQLAINAGIEIQQLRESYPRLTTQYRDADRQFMQTLHSTPQQTLRFAIKGSPLEVLARCSAYWNGNEVVPFVPHHRYAIAQENDRMAHQALRVLGVAYGETPLATSAISAIETPEPMIWLGLVGMADPIRPGVKEVIGVLHQAGIDTIMVTGDQPSTAYAIGQAIDLSQGKPLNIVDYTDCSSLIDQDLNLTEQPIHIFARISPTHKLQVVQSLQRLGQVVAMTGDGVNDTPALKAAEVGIAMGQGGTDVAREVADVVLEDDNLATMAIAISQGRTIYSNIRKSVHFLLSTNLSEIIVMLASTSLGMGYPLNAVQLLWLNLVTDIFPGLALALEPAEPTVLQQSPRDPKESIIPMPDFKRIVWESTMLAVSALGAYSYALWNYGIGFHASTIGFMSLVLAQLLHAISCRSQSRVLFSPKRLPMNLYLAIALLGSIGLQFITGLVPGLQSLLHVVPLNLLDYAMIAISACLPLLVNEATKN
jgi:Ca2+-transporting ATPase